MDKIPKNQLKALFGDIIRGFSEIETSLFGRLYIKHLSVLEVTDIDVRSEKLLKETLKKGIPSTKDKEEQLIKDNLWLPRQENEINELSLYVKNLNITKSKYFQKTELDTINKEIVSATQKLTSLLEKKHELLGLVAEYFVNLKTNYYYIEKCFFRDEELKTKFWINYNLENLSEDDFNFLVKTYTEHCQNFQSKTLERISLLPIFLNGFYLSKNNPQTFWGKPIINLTLFQSEIFSHGLKFKNILQELRSEPTEEMLDNPEKLIEHYNSTKNISKLVDSKTDGNTMVFGVSNKELNELGFDAKDLSKEAKRKGKSSLSMDELAAL